MNPNTLANIRRYILKTNKISEIEIENLQEKEKRLVCKLNWSSRNTKQSLKNWEFKGGK